MPVGFIYLLLGDLCY